MSTAALDAARSRILQAYQVTPAARLHGGMEAEVYAYGPDAVLKLYAGTTSLTNLRLLHDFYDSLDRQRVPYALPCIQTIAQDGPVLITIEQRLTGTPLSTVLPARTSRLREVLMQRYLDTALAVAQISVTPAWDCYKLFDAERLSARSDGDWHQFLARFLALRLVAVAPYLQRDVPRFAAKVQHLTEILSQPYRGDNRLIHGDFCPSNLLVDSDDQVTGLLDFGLLTMTGDALFDLATGWVFLDMYDELRAHIRERYLAMLLDRLGTPVRGQLYRYVLLYSILSANTYAADCSDGHYQWCVANLSNQDYWRAIA